MRTPAPSQGSEKGEAVRPRCFKCGKSSGCHNHTSDPALKWNADCFLKNGGILFTRGTDPKAALIWFDDTEVVLEHMGCPLELWVQVTDRVIRG